MLYISWWIGDLPPASVCVLLFLHGNQVEIRTWPGTQRRQKLRKIFKCFQLHFEIGYPHSCRVASTLDGEPFKRFAISLWWSEHATEINVSLSLISANGMKKPTISNVSFFLSLFLNLTPLNFSLGTICADEGKEDDARRAQPVKNWNFISSFFFFLVL